MEKIMYMKFNNRNTHASLMQATKDSIVVVNKKLPTIEGPCIEQEQPQEEVVLLWQQQIHENYIRTRTKGGDAQSIMGCRR